MYFTARLIVHRARTGGDMLVCAMRHARTAMSKSVSARLAQRIWNQAAPIVFLIFLCAACTHAQSTPTITSVSPTTGGAGTVIEVYGSNFGGSQGSSTVTINGTSLGTSSYWTQGQAQFTLPAGLSSGNLVVNVGGTATNGIPFTYAIPPSITSSVSPAPNSGGWLNRNATVTFTCTAGTYPIASCPSPQTVSSDGLGQIVSGTVVDTAGDMATASATINLDKTIPTLAVSSPADQTVESSSAVTVSGTLTDALSGVT